MKHKAPHIVEFETSGRLMATGTRAFHALADSVLERWTKEDPTMLPFSTKETEELASYIAGKWLNWGGLLSTYGREDLTEQVIARLAAFKEDEETKRKVLSHQNRDQNVIEALEKKLSELSKYTLHFDTSNRFECELADVQVLLKHLVSALRMNA